MTEVALKGGFVRARDGDGKVIISKTTLRALLPCEISRMTDSQKQMCGCELCIIAKSQTTSLNAWRTKYRNHLEE